ncbi:MAG: polysaccharide biosynthesis protein [Bacilli bacterium]|nr:polysaccharide biosynthesis protein [Bacilli bacterium]
MKKSAFVQGAMIATIGIIISRIIGIIYVIPFYAIIGEQGGALYSYAYSIYSVFLSLSTVGIPLAISKITSEYIALDEYNLKNRAYKISRKLLLSLSFLSFIILIIFAPAIAHLFIGNVTGGNTIEDVAFVIRMVSTAILIVPSLSILRGYLQGHKYITPSSISQVVEQIVRVIFVLIGSFVCIKIFNWPLRTAVGIACFGATVGALIAYLYLLRKIRKNKKSFIKNTELKREESKVTDKEIFKKVIFYAIPFIISGLVTSIYNFVDLSTIVKTMVNTLHYTASTAESVVSIIATWGSKLNMIIISIGSGLVVSLLPNITDSFVKGNKEELNNRINKSMQLLLYITIPLTVLLSTLATPIWTFFFGYSELGILVFRFSIFTALFLSLLQTLNTIFQSINEHKRMVIYLIIGLLTKIIFNVPLMCAFDSFGLNPSYGANTATIIGLMITSILILIYLKKALRVNYEGTFKKVLNIIMSTIIMTIVLLLFQFIIPIGTHNRLLALLLTLLYGLIGGAVYLFITTKNGLLKEVFGDSFINKILIKLRIKKAK